MKKTEYNYINKWWSIEEINKHLEDKNIDKDQIAEVIGDILKYAKVRHLVKVKD